MVNGLQQRERGGGHLDLVTRAQCVEPHHGDQTRHGPHGGMQCAGAVGAGGTRPAGGRRVIDQRGGQGAQPSLDLDEGRQVERFDSGGYGVG